MSVQIPLLALQNNDTAYYFKITFNGAILDLTPYTVKAYQKASQTALDSSGITYQVGSGITVTSAPLGQVKLIVPHANVTAPGVQWWHLDLIDVASSVFTVFYGPFTIKAI